MRSLVLASGGIDSLVALYDTLIIPRSEVHLLYVDYGQNNRHLEEKCVEQWSCISGVTKLHKSLLLLPYHDPAYVKPADIFMHVPWRNLNLIAKAAVYAKQLQCDEIVVGMHSSDYDEYFDCRPNFINAVSDVLALGDPEPIILVTPNLYHTKAQVVEKGIDFKIDFSMTWTCYKAGPKSCGECAACIGRKAAFAVNGVIDPLEGN